MNQFLECSNCGNRTEFEPETVCRLCFGPLNVSYDYETLRKSISRKAIESRPKSMWRYAELLPEVQGGTPDTPVGFTPLLHAKRLGEILGLSRLYIKNDSVNFPTLSFKDRVVSVALAKAIDFGFDKVGCASTGNLANSVAAQATRLGLESIILIPDDLEQQKVIASACYNSNVIKVRGNYDDVNRLCTELSYREKIGIVNVNLRPFYSEGSKTVGFEIAEQLGWQLPDQVIVPMAGGSLISKIDKAFKELVKVGLVEEKTPKIFGGQPKNCSPISAMVKSGAEELIPVKPNTVVKSLAIGAPSDGHRAANIIRNSNGWAEDVTDSEAVAGISLLAETEGIFTEAAGGVTVSVTKKLVEQGKLDKSGITVICITGNGLKTADLVNHRTDDLSVIEAKYSSYKQLATKQEETANVSTI